MYTRYLVRASHSIDGIEIVIMDTHYLGYPVVERVMMPSSIDMMFYLDSEYGDWEFEE